MHDMPPGYRNPEFGPDTPEKLKPEYVPPDPPLSRHGHSDVPQPIGADVPEFTRPRLANNDPRGSDADRPPAEDPSLAPPSGAVNPSLPRAWWELADSPAALDAAAGTNFDGEPPDDGPEPLSLEDVRDAEGAIVEALETIAGQEAFAPLSPLEARWAPPSLVHETSISNVDDLPPEARAILDGIPLSEGTQMVSYALRLEAKGTEQTKETVAQVLRREDDPTGRTLTEWGVSYRPAERTTDAGPLFGCWRSVEGNRQDYDSMVEGGMTADRVALAPPGPQARDIFPAASGPELREVTNLIRRLLGAQPNST